MFDYLIMSQYLNDISCQQLCHAVLVKNYFLLALFLTFIEHCLLLELSKGDVVIMDNAPFHKSTNIKELIESKGARLLYLPRYSPDINPIEQYWFGIKNQIRQKLDEGAEFQQAIDLAFSLYV